MKHNLIIALLLCVLLPSIEAKESTRILFIGNSYTGQIKKVFTDMIKFSAQLSTHD